MKSSRWYKDEDFILPNVASQMNGYVICQAISIKMIGPSNYNNNYLGDWNQALLYELKKTEYFYK